PPALPKARQAAEFRQAGHRLRLFGTGWACVTGTHQSLYPPSTARSARRQRNVTRLLRGFLPESAST
ncbi:hypothetical protein VXQ18_09555, partial [Brucella abortus]|nr:hypothetical protein [Brucella abortus]